METVTRAWTKMDTCLSVSRLEDEERIWEMAKGEAQCIIKNITTIRAHNFTSGYLSKGNKNTNSKRYLQPHFIKALFTIAKTQK